MRTIHATICTALIAGFAVPVAAQTVTGLTGATVINPGAAPVADAVIVIESGRIARVGPASSTAIPPNATVIDLRGKYVMPGLADMHNHVRVGGFRLQQNPRISLSLLLASGVTTVFNPSASLAELKELRTATAPESAPFPRLFSSGPIVTTKGDFFGAMVGAPVPETPEQARAAVASLKGAGVDAIKVARDDASWAMTRRAPIMSSEVLAALVAEAHREGLKVFAHAPLLEHALVALEAGVDGLLHGIVDRPVDARFLELMGRNRAVYVPTLSLYEDVADVSAWGARQSRHDERRLISPLADAFATGLEGRQFAQIVDNPSFVRDRLATQRANLKRVADAGIPIVMGTDAGFFGVLAGVSSQLELALMVEAGLTPAAALRAATIEAARMIGRDKELGSVEPGKMADLLVLDANPLDEILNIRRIHRVVRGGAVYDPAELVKGIRFGPLPPAR